jgi:hypothetical protein
MKASFAVVALAATTLAQAHSGHGPMVVHWHATDVWGFAALGLAAGAAALWARWDK